MVAVAEAEVPAENEKSETTESERVREPWATESEMGVTETTAEEEPAGMRMDEAGAM